MDIASSTRAAEDRAGWKEIVANLSVVPRRHAKVMGYNRIVMTAAIPTRQPLFRGP